MKRNLDLYNEYLESCYATHYETKDTTYVTYKSYMTQFIKSAGFEVLYIISIPPTGTG